jgi:hypothetical protein
MDPLFVSKLVVHGVSTPSFKSEDKMNTTKVNYGRGKDQLTELGLNNMYKLGQKTKEELNQKSNILTQFYSPRFVFVRSMLDPKVINSAYAYLLGMYPFSVNGVTFKTDFIGNWEQVPINDVSSIRTILGLGDKI